MSTAREPAGLAAATNAAAPPEWDLRDLYASPEAPEVEADLARALNHATALEAEAKGRLAALDGAALGTDCLVVRYFGTGGDDRLLLCNLGGDLLLAPAPQPLLAPPAGRAWRILWSSDDTRYGGPGTAPVETDRGWQIPGESALVMIADVPSDSNSPLSSIQPQ